MTPAVRQLRESLTPIAHTALELDDEAGSMIGGILAAVMGCIDGDNPIDMAGLRYLFAASGHLAEVRLEQYYQQLGRRGIPQ